MADFKYIGFVESSREDITDDNWGNVISKIVINKDVPIESLQGLDLFSHIEVIFHMHKVNPSKINLGSRHPRNNVNYPKMGIFAQRAKARPNMIGVSRCKLLELGGNELIVQSLDAINGTPVLDIKPYFKEFGPIGLVKQPDWVSELMKNYYN